MKKEFDKTGPNQQGLVSNIKDQTIKDYEAIASALKAAELEPNNAELQYKLASAHLKIGDSPSAIESALKAVNLNPNHVLYRAKLAEAYLVLGKCEEAKTHWEVAVLFEPGNAEYQAKLAEAYSGLGNYQKAVECLLQATADSA